MIQLNDALILASTKLHVHRIRTLLTVLLSSLLFSALIGSVIISEGITKSVTAFNSEGLNNHYLVLAQADSPFTGNVLGNNEIIKLAQQKGEELIIAKKAEAKRLGIDYIAANEPSAVITQTSLGQNTSTHINFQSYAATEAIQEYATQHPSSGINELKQAASSYHPTSFYTSTDTGVSSGAITIMQDGKENLTPSDNERVDLDFFHNTPLSIVDSNLTKPFILSNSGAKNGNIPLIISYSTAEKILGLDKLPSSASAKQRYDRVRQLYTEISKDNTTIHTCYRNSVSQQQIDLAISQADEIAKNKDKKDYQKPSLIYGLPATETCSQATIISDTRTNTEKKAQVAQDQFDSEFGQVVTPMQQKLTFQVIGLSPSESDNNNTTFSSILSGIVGSSLTNGANVIPSDLLDQMQNASAIKSIILSNNGNPLSAPRPNYYVEFSSAADAKAFIDEKSCSTGSDGICASPGRLFQLMTSGNNSIALQDLLKKITQIITIATLIVTALAIVIMTSMVGRTIADSRRETAVFRALGAKRGDIAVVYSAYTLCLTIFIAIISLLGGIGFAYSFNAYYSQDTTLQAKLLFDAVNSNLSFNFFSINTRLLGIVMAVILIAGIISVFIPLLRNVSRNPIKDMRDE